MAVFTDKFLRGLKPREAGFEERDAGCPGLLIRVGQRGRKVWEVVVAENGRRRRVRLGAYPDVSLAMARRLAADAKAAPTLHSSGLRVADLWEMYAAEKRPTRRAFADVEMVWRKWAEPLLGSVRLEDVSIRHGAELVAKVTKKSTPNRARKCVRYLSPMFAFAAGRGLIQANPWSGLQLPEGVERRDRVLTVEERAAVMRWAMGEPYPFGPFMRFLMLSAQRLGDVAGMRWDEIEGDVWAIPAARHKSKRRHEVPLSAALAGILEDVPRHDAHVFTIRRAPGEAGEMVSKPIAPGNTLIRRLQAETKTEGWRFHDLRRTGATVMGEAGVLRFVIERVLGHADHSVTAIYDRATYRAEKRAALETLAAAWGCEAGAKDGAAA